jgi:RND family efflux transporter MFP subunit
MPVTLGQRVHAGDLLARIGADEISARVAQAEAQLNAARRDLERERGLAAKGASTAETVKDLEDRLSGAQATLREAAAMQGYTSVRAPFDGIVARKFAGVGDLASPGLPLLEIEGADGFQVEAALPDSLASRLSPGAVLTVCMPARDATFAGTLAELSSAADPGAHTVTAKIRVPAGVPVRSGEFARVQLEGAPVQALMVPASAVATVGQMQLVFVAGADGRASLRLVRTGAARGDLVEVLSGVDAGERVVAAPPVGLREGRRLEIQP